MQLPLSPNNSTLPEVSGGVAEQVPAAVKSADRVLNLLELLGRWDRELSHTEIATALSIPKGSLTLLLRNLVNRGYINYASSTKRYRLGAAFAALARQSGCGFDLISCAKPILNKITSVLGETSALNQLKGRKAEVVATALSPQRLVLHMRLGELAPLYATSGGKAILASLPEDKQKEYLASVRLDRITSKTINSINTLKRELETIRRSGLAYSFEEFTPGIVGVAAAVIPKSGQTTVALNIAVPAVRSSPELLERAGQVLLRAAREMAAQVDQATT